MKKIPLLILLLLLSLMIFDVGLLHINSYPATYTFYGIVGSVLFMSAALILSTILKKNEKVLEQVLDNANKNIHKHLQPKKQQIPKVTISQINDSYALRERPKYTDNSNELSTTNTTISRIKIFLLPLIVFIIPIILGLLGIIPIAIIFIAAGFLHLILSPIILYSKYQTQFFSYIKFTGLPIFILFFTSLYLLSNTEQLTWSINWLGLRNIAIQISELNFPRGIFALIFIFGLCVGLIYASIQAAKPLEISGALIFGGGAIGITLSPHLVPTLIFCEIMTIGATLILWASKIQGSKSVSFRFLMINIFGGLLFLIGICIMQLKGDSLILETITPKHAGHYFVLSGLFIKITAPPFWSWIADTYSKASPTGSFFLSMLITNTGIFLLLMLFKGQEFLAPIGLIMAFYGIIFALNCRDIRKILSYCIVSQSGYLVVAIGIGSIDALTAISIQVISQTLCIGILMMITGNLLADNPESDIHSLGNLCETKPYSALFAVFTGLALCGMPFALSFTSKMMLSNIFGQSSITNKEIAFMLELASGAMPLYIGLRWPWLVFFRNTNLKTWLLALLNKKNLQHESVNIVCYLLFAAPLIIITPYLLHSFNLIPNANFQYTLADITHQFQLILASACVFIFTQPFIIPKHFALYDFDILYRKLILGLLRICFYFIRLPEKLIKKSKLIFNSKS